MQSDPQPLRILVADDNKDAADAMTVLLEMSGHRVTTVYDGEAALRAVVEERPQLAILDIGMPRMNGYEVATAIRAAITGTVLIAVSGWGNPADVKLAIESGFHQHFTKPVAFADIESIIRNLESSPARHR